MIHLSVPVSGEVSVALYRSGDTLTDMASGNFADTSALGSAHPLGLPLQGAWSSVRFPTPLTQRLNKDGSEWGWETLNPRREGGVQGGGEWGEEEEREEEFWRGNGGERSGRGERVEEVEIEKIRKEKEEEESALEVGAGGLGGMWGWRDGARDRPSCVGEMSSTTARVSGAQS